jgi:hypothetical protein
MLSLASLADRPALPALPPLLAAPASTAIFGFTGETGERGRGFHETAPPGLGRTGGGAPPPELEEDESDLGFSNAAMRSRSDPGLGFGAGGAGGSDIIVFETSFEGDCGGCGQDACCCDALRVPTVDVIGRLFWDIVVQIEFFVYSRLCTL